MAPIYDGPAAVARDEASIGVDVRSNADTTASVSKQDWLIAECEAAMSAATWADFDRAGIPRPGPLGPMPFGVARVRTCGRFYEPDPDGGDFAYVVPAAPMLPLTDGDWPSWHPDDLVCFRLAEPRRWSRRTGDADIINPFALDYAKHYKTPLQISATPLSWLRGGGVGIAIVDLSVDFHSLLGGVLDVKPETDALGAYIDRRLNEPLFPLPRIAPAIGRAT